MLNSQLTNVQLVTDFYGTSGVNQMRVKDQQRMGENGFNFADFFAILAALREKKRDFTQSREERRVKIS